MLLCCLQHKIDICKAPQQLIHPVIYVQWKILPNEIADSEVDANSDS